MKNASSMPDETLDLTNYVWYNWTPREELVPVFNEKIIDNDKIMAIASGNKFECYGKWLCDVNEIKGGNIYRFSVEYKAFEVDSEEVSVAAILTWSNSNGRSLASDYADIIYRSEDGWVGLGRELDAPADAASVTVELILRWTEHGSVHWRRPKLALTAKALLPRKVKVATTQAPQKSTPEANLTDIQELIDKAGIEKPDVICLGETVIHFGTGIVPLEAAESIPGHLTQMISDKAKKYNTYIIFSMYERENGCIYNTAVLIDRKGEIAGKYRKTHLPLCEAEAGVTPGNEYPVFKTDFGTVGMIICWDHWFPETARIIRQNGAEILFIPTLGYAPAQARARAVDNGLYVVVSGRKDFPEDASCIFNPVGELLGTIQDERVGYVIKEIDLEQRYLQYWLSVADGFGEAKSLYLKERRPDTYHKLLDNTR
jgi:predicted amidohydrolase